ncbi:MAG: PAS domain S-box protein [Gammaproteobacteria bacterium]|nr:PAS domain S-box protein [Gammaproteobacteria bacterium]
MNLKQTQLNSANENLPRTILAGILVGLIYTFFAWNYTENIVCWYWFLTHVLVSIFRLATSFYVKTDQELHFRTRALLLQLGNLMSAVVWGSGLFLVDGASSPHVVYSVMLIYAGLVTASALATALHSTLYYSFAVPLLMCTVVWVFRNRESFTTEFLVFFGIFVLGVLALSRAVQKQFVQHITLWQTNADMAGRLGRVNEELQNKIEESKARELALNESQEKFRILMETIPDAVLMVNEEGIIRFCNSSSEGIFGVSTSQLLQMCVDDLIPTEMSINHQHLREEYFKDMRARTMSGGIQIDAKRANGVVFPAQVDLFPTTIRGEKYVVAIVRDLSERSYLEYLSKEIAERTNAEDRLKKVLSEYELINATMQDIVYQLDLSGGIVWFNSALQRMTGWEESDMWQRNALEFVSTEDRDRVQAAFDSVMAVGSDEIDAVLQTKAGPRVFHIKGSVLRNANGQIIGQVGTGRDITERRITEQELINSQIRFEMSQQFANIGTWELNPQTKEIVWSQQVWRLMGAFPGAFERTFENFLSRIHVDDRQDVDQAILFCVREHIELDTRFRFQWENGSVGWVNLKGNVEIDRDGTARRVLGVLIDIDKVVKSESEKMRLQRQLQQAQKMEAIGELTGGIAHDFNNMLTSILGYSKLVTEMPDSFSKEDIVQYVKKISLAGQRARDMVKQLLAFSRDQTDVFEPVQMPMLVNEVVDMLGPTMPSSVEIVCDIGEDIPIVQGTIVQLQQVLMNLCINARDAMEGQGRIKIQLGVKQNAHSTCSACFQTFIGDYVVLEVEDSGAGIDESLLERIFDPFVTTKEVGKGSGMGLSMVQAIVHQHRGHLEVQSQPGCTRFSIFLPTSDCLEVADNKEVVNSVIVDGNQARVLVVDDEESIVELYGILFEMYGYEVTAMTDPKAALELVKQNPYAFDVIVTDYTMPGITGEELSRQILALREDMPILMCTGYSERMDEKKAHAMGIRAFLMKPVEPLRILESVAELAQAA